MVSRPLPFYSVGRALPHILLNIATYWLYFFILGYILTFTIGQTPMPTDKKEQEFLDAYKQYADSIYRHCYFRVYNKELAEDLTQETFIKTWKYIAQGKEIKNIKAFLYRVAVNLITFSNQ